MAALLVAALGGCGQNPAEWTAQEQRQIASLSLSRLSPPPADPSNRYADDPLAASLGELLFSDPRLSRNGQVACATCHQPGRAFTDGLPQSQGLARLARNAPSLLSVAWNRWQFWDGRADSLWAQALGPLTHASEQGSTHGQIAEHLLRYYRPTYENIFGEIPEELDAAEQTRIAVNAAKSLAAFQRSLRPAATRFDAYAEALGKSAPPPTDSLSESEKRGLRLFIGNGQCLRCHNGPLFTNQGFHNTGLSDKRLGLADRGRADGLPLALKDPLNCKGAYSDDPARACPQLDYAYPGNAEWLGAFKVPSLRGVAQTAPYMHDGRFATLEEVIAHYNRAPNLDGIYGHSELRPLNLDAQQQADLAALLRTL